MRCGPIFIDFEWCSLHLLDFDVCSLCHIREVLSSNCLQYTFCSLSLSSFSGIPIILMLCHLMMSLISRILALWSSSCLSLLCSASLFSVIWSSISLILSSASFILPVRASTFYCTSLLAFLISTWLDFSSFISPERAFLFLQTGFF